MAHSKRKAEIVDTDLIGWAAARSISDHVDQWLRDLCEVRLADRDTARLAVAAVGGYGRRELSPESDLDVMLLHDGLDDDELADIAQLLWYPIWDAGFTLGHSVRTAKEALELASDDLETATSLLSLRWLAGNSELVDALAEEAAQQWHSGRAHWLPLLATGSRDRRRSSGEVAFLLEPDLKGSGGGLRDAHALLWAVQAGADMIRAERMALIPAYETLLGVRVELHRSAGRKGDVLLLEDQDLVAERLGVSGDQLMGLVAAAGRTIGGIADDVWARSLAQGRREGLWEAKQPHQINADVVVDNGIVRLTETERWRDDPGVLLDVANAAADYGARIDRLSLDRLAAELAPIPEPWPIEFRRRFTDLLLSGRAAIDVIESLDRVGLMVRLIPEWAPTRSKPQRNIYHRFTVDRHLCEAAAEAADLADRVDRPDLLVVGALLHDIGKGYPGDHSIVGRDLVYQIAPRMGFDPRETELLAGMAEHHLVLPDVATRRDVDDQGTVSTVADQINDLELLPLLGALTKADSIATGPSAWSRWKESLVETLVRRVANYLSENHIDSGRDFPGPELRAKMAANERGVWASENEVTVLSEDRHGGFLKTVGSLTAQGLDIVLAQAHSERGMAAQWFLVKPVLPIEVDWDEVAAGVSASIADEVDIDAEIQRRRGSYRRRRPTSGTPIVGESFVKFDNDISAVATVAEIAATDRVGVLYDIVKQLVSCGLNIQQARVQTLGEEVVDSFYISDADNTKVTDPAVLAQIESSVLAALVGSDAS